MIDRTKVASGSSKGYGVGVRISPHSTNLQPHRVFLLPSNLTRCLEVDTKERLVSLIILADILDRVDMERDGKPVNGQDNGRRFSINEDLRGVNQGLPYPRRKLILTRRFSTSFGRPSSPL